MSSWSSGEMIAAIRPFVRCCKFTVICWTKTSFQHWIINNEPLTTDTMIGTRIEPPSPYFKVHTFYHKTTWSFDLTSLKVWIRCMKSLEELTTSQFIVARMLKKTWTKLYNINTNDTLITFFQLLYTELKINM